MMACMIWLTIIIFVALLLALVLVHEWGHLIAAKKAGCNVEEFGFGFPPRLFSVMWHGTKYSFNLLPIGGFVKIEGEDMEDKNPGPTSFASKSAGWRIVILSAGVFMNVVLAFVLLSIQAGVGTPTIVTEENRGQLAELKTYILDVDENSPASMAGLIALDRIVRINDTTDPTIEEVQAIVGASAGGPVTLEIERQGKHEIISVAGRENPPEGEGALGVSLAATGLERVPWWQAPLAGLKRTGAMLAAILVQFVLIIQRLVGGGGLGQSLTGPVGIAVYANEVTALGLSYILEFGALISLNLAIINILPFPALDGGRIIFVVLEKIAGRRFPGKIEQVTHLIGFGLLILLMVAITFRDVQRFF